MKKLEISAYGVEGVKGSDVQDINGGILILGSIGSWIKWGRRVLEFTGAIDAATELKDGWNEAGDSRDFN